MFVCEENCREWSCKVCSMNPLVVILSFSPWASNCWPYTDQLFRWFRSHIQVSNFRIIMSCHVLIQTQSRCLKSAFSSQAWPWLALCGQLPAHSTEAQVSDVSVLSDCRKGGENVVTIEWRRRSGQKSLQPPECTYKDNCGQKLLLSAPGVGREMNQVTL